MVKYSLNLQTQQNPEPKKQNETQTTKFAEKANWVHPSHRRLKLISYDLRVCNLLSIMLL